MCNIRLRYVMLHMAFIYKVPELFFYNIIKQENHLYLIAIKSLFISEYIILEYPISNINLEDETNTNHLMIKYHHCNSN